MTYILKGYMPLRVVNYAFNDEMHQCSNLFPVAEQADPLFPQSNLRVNSHPGTPATGRQ